jgi:AraC-like DNA-binding protein
VQSLKQAVRHYAGRHANSDGLAVTPVPGLRMMRIDSPRGALHSVYRPLVCVVLQGAKHMIVGREERVFSAGQSVIVAADMPVTGRIVQASPNAPYLAIAVELDMSILRDVATQTREGAEPPPSGAHTLFAEDTDAEILGCVSRLVRLIERPAATPLLRPAILWELHYWLLSGSHGAALRALAAPASHASRLAAAVVILRQQFRTRISIEKLAAAAAMSPTAFHKHFKHMTSLTPGQYQKRLRLIEARRLMLDEGLSATGAALEVGYESISQFTREYGRMFKMTPKRDALRGRTAAARPADRVRISAAG